MDRILTSFAQFASDLSYRDLPASVVTASKERLLDTVGCALGAYDCDTAAIGRSLAAPAARKELAGRMLGSKKLAAADAAGFVNSCMIRNLDFNDAISGGHPSDSLGGLFAVAPLIEASGEQLVTATVVAYELIIRLQMRAQLRQKGWDQSFVIGVGTAAGLANLMGLSREATQHAIAITAVGNTAMRATRAGQLSMWKGAATAYAVRNAVFGVQLAAAGMSGPEAPFTGRHGLIELISGPIDLPPFGATAEDFLILKTKTKYWPVANNMQALVWAGIELRKQVSADQLASVDVQTYWSAWHESGSEPAKWDPRTRETADHSLPYILAWTLRHGLIDERAFVPESYLDPSIRPLMNTITARIEDGIDKEFPRVIHMRLNAKDHSGKAYEVNTINPLGHEDNRMSAKDLAVKFRRLCEPRLGKRRTTAALRQWQNIETAANTKGAFDAVNVKATV